MRVLEKHVTAFYRQADLKEVGKKRGKITIGRHIKFQGTHLKVGAGLRRGGIILKNTISSSQNKRKRYGKFVEQFEKENRFVL